MSWSRYDWAPYVPVAQRRASGASAGQNVRTLTESHRRVSPPATSTARCPGLCDRRSLMWSPLPHADATVTVHASWTEQICPEPMGGAHRREHQRGSSQKSTKHDCRNTLAPMSLLRGQPELRVC